MKEFIRGNRVFIILFAAVFAAIGTAITAADKAELHLWLNSCHTLAGDTFFPYYTKIADYGFYIIALALLFWRAGATIYLMIAEGAGALIVQAVKHIVNAPRPKIFFDLENNPDALPVVEGVKMHSHYSFPSGHTCTFFILFFCLSVLFWYYSQERMQTREGIKKETHWHTSLQIVCFLAALLGGYSRVYLSQHFTTDVFAGGIIGVCVVAALYPAFVWLNNKFPKVCAWHISLPRKQKA